MFLGCVIDRRGIGIQLPSFGLAKNIILNTIESFRKKQSYICRESGKERVYNGA